MRTHSIALSVLILMLEMVSARAKPCNYTELLNQWENLPAFIVIPEASTAEDVLARALCTLPPPSTFAGGERVDPKEVIGHQVFTQNGKHIGSVAGFTVNPETSKMTSVVLTSDRTGTNNAAVPFSELILDKKTSRIVTEGSDEQDLDKKWPIGSQMVLFDNSFLGVFNCPMCAYPSLIKIDITSDPPGGKIFIAEQQQGSTELHGFITSNKELTIRIEYPKRKACGFADGTYTPPKTTDGYATFFCKLAP